MNAAAHDALRRLIDGAERHAAGRPTGLLNSPAPTEMAAAPLRVTAAVLACAEPDTSPETIFGEVAGGLFVVRTAGHVLDDATLGSLEFAVAELGVRLVVVMGHEACRAVSAAITRPTATGDLGLILDAIEPAVLRAKHHGAASPDDLLEEAVTEHIRATGARSHSWARSTARGRGASPGCWSPPRSDVPTARPPRSSRDPRRSRTEDRGKRKRQGRALPQAACQRKTPALALYHSAGDGQPQPAVPAFVVIGG
jgi:carbonic anhydrase